MDRLQAMRHFVTVVDCGSFSSAAKQLRIGQPAVSKSIAQLEDRLQVQLITRSTRSHALTEAGRRFYERARSALDEADAAEAAARNEATALTGRLRVSAPPVYASQVILPLLGQFVEQHPDIIIDLVLDDRWIDLIEEGIDLAIRAGDLGDSTLIARRIDRAQRMLAASPDYLARCGTPQVPGEIPQHRIASYIAFESLTNWTFTRGSERQSVAIEAHLRVSAADGLRAALLAGLGIGLVTDRMVGRELAAGSLVPVLPDWSLAHSDVWVVFPEGRRVRQRARLFADWLQTAIMERSASLLA